MTRTTVAAGIEAGVEARITRRLEKNGSFLVFEEAGYITRQILPVSGGRKP